MIVTQLSSFQGGNDTCTSSQTVHKIDERQTHLYCLLFNVRNIKGHVTEMLTILISTIHWYTGVCLC